MKWATRKNMKTDRLACVWLIRWTAQKRPGEGAAGDTTGHEGDGLLEYNNPMPRWWLGLFYPVSAPA